MLLTMAMVFSMMPSVTVFAAEEEDLFEEPVVLSEEEALEEPTEAQEPTEAEEFTEPTEPEETTEPTEPTEPEEPTEPTEPEETTEPTEPTEPTETTEPTEPEENSVELFVESPMDEEAAEEVYGTFLSSLFFGDGGASYGTAAGRKLTGANKFVYDALRPGILKIAQGAQTSTVIPVSMGNYTPDDFDLRLVTDALYFDLPFEMFWYFGCGCRGNNVNGEWKLEFPFLPAANYRPAGYDEKNPTIDLTEVRKAVNAADNAKAIAERFAGYDDYEKLCAFADEICYLVEYDRDAAKNGTYNLNINPWTLVNVFDKDFSTKVVCEGYAEAFQYLCDLSTFQGDVEVYCATGNNHKWNIVRIEGQNYLMDVTHCDYGTTANRGPKFFGGGSGSIEAGYVIDDFHYKYYDDTISIYGTGEDSILKLAPTKYVPGASAPDTPKSFYTLENGVLTITGPMEDYEAFRNPAPWYDRREEITRVVIEAGVTFIGSNAFYGCGNLTTVSIPESVTVIGDNAFSECSSLTAVTLPGRIEYLGASAFYRCSSLREINIPENLTSIGLLAFYGCSALTQITLPASLLELGFGAFQGSGLTSVSIPASMTSIPYAVFSDCASLASVTLPQNLETISADAFANSGLKAISIPDGVMNISYGAFASCASLQSVSLPSAPLRIEHNAFENCSALPGVTFPEGVWSIGEEAFRSCTGLEELRFLGDAPAIAQNAFYDVTATAYYPVDNTTWTEEIRASFGGSLTWVSDGSGEEDPYTGTCGENLTWRYDQATKTLTISGDGTMDDFIGSPFPWIGFRDEITNVVIEDGVRNIAHMAFYFYENLTSVTMSDTVNHIGNAAFYFCKNLTKVTLSKGLKTIGDSAFAYCYNLPQLTLPESLRSFGRSAFQASGLEAVEIPGSVTNITYAAFSSCASLASATIGGSVERIEECAFDYCISLPSITIPDRVNQIDRSAFAYNQALEEIRFEGDAPTFESNVFENVTATAYYPADNTTWTPSVRQNYGGSLTWIAYADGEEVPDSGTCGENLTWRYDRETKTLTISGEGAMDSFQYDTDRDAVYSPWHRYQDQVNRVVLNEGVTAIGQNAFRSFPALESVSLPTTLTGIREEAFYGCARLREVTLPQTQSPCWILPDAFLNCPNLKEITLPESVKLYSNSLGYLSGEDDYEKVDGFTITAPVASGAHFYALENGFQFTANGVCVPAFQKVGIASEDLPVYWAAYVDESVGSVPAGAEVYTCGEPNDNNRAMILGIRQDDGTIVLGDFSESQLKDAADKLVRGWIDLSMISAEPERVLLVQGEEQIEALTLDMAECDLAEIAARVQPGNANQAVTWASSKTDVAEVDAGKIKMKKPGTTVITAAAVDDPSVKASLTLTVYYVDTAAKLTAKVEDIPDIGLQPGQGTTMMVYGSDKETAIAPGKLEFTSSNTQIAAVDENGVITAGETPDTATITARIQGDPLKREVSVKVKVIAMQAEALSLKVGDNKLDALTLAKSADSRTYDLTALGRNFREEWFETNNVTWTATDDSVAKVTVAKDGTAKLTIPGGANGECVITATAKDLNKAQAQLTVSVRDYSPRLGSSKLTLNSYSTEGIPLDLRASYHNRIKGVELVNPPEGFRLDNETWKLYGNSEENDRTVVVAKGTHTLKLKVTCEREIAGEQDPIVNNYFYNLRVTVTNTLPSVTVKQPKKLNVFFGGSETALKLTTSAHVYSVALTGTEDFHIIPNFEEGGDTVTIAYRDDPVAKPDTKATLLLYVDGYCVPVKKAVTISTVTTAPKLKLNATSAVVNVTEGNVPAVTLWVEPMEGVPTISTDDITCEPSFAKVFKDGEKNTLTLKLTKNAKGVYTGGTATLQVQAEHWAKAVELKCKVSVSTETPTLKLGATTLTLNRYFTGKTAQTAVKLDQQNLELTNVEIKPSNAKQSAQTDKLSVSYNDGRIYASIQEGQTPAAGTYTYSCTGKTVYGETKRVTLKVVVSNTLPKVKLSASSVKLNASLAGQEIARLKATITGGAGYTLMGFEGAPNWLNLSYEDGTIGLRLSEVPKTTKSVVELKPVFCLDGTDQELTLPTAIKLTVQTYKKAPGITLSAKGKLDTQKPGSALVLTPKLSNGVGTVTGAILDEAYSTAFNVAVEDGLVYLTLKTDVTYVTNKSYSVKLKLRVNQVNGEEGWTVEAKPLSFKVTQSKGKLTAAPTTVTLYQAQSQPATGRLTLSTGEIGSIALSDKNTASMKRALGLSSTITGNTAQLAFALKNPYALKAGKSYTLYLDVTPTHNASNLAPTQMKLTVKVQK